MTDPAIEKTVATFDRLHNTRGIGCAEPFLAEQVERNPNSHVLRGHWAAALLSRGRLEEAEAQAAMAVDLDPSSIEGRAASVRIILFKGHLDEAFDAAALLVADHPNHLMALRVAYAIQSQIPGSPEAEECLKRLMSAPDSDPRDYFLFLLAKLRRQDRVGAREGLRNCPEEFRSCYLCPLFAARLEFTAKNLKEAYELYREAAAMAPESDDAWAGLAMCQAVMGRLEEADQSANFALEVDYRNPSALGAKAIVARKRGDFAEAARIRSQRQELVPRLSCLAVLDRARAEARRGNLEAADRILRELENDKSRTARRLGLYQRLIWLILSDDRELLTECLSKAPSESRMDEIVVAAEAKLDILNGKAQEAVERLEEAMYLFPNRHELSIVWIEAKKKMGCEKEVEARAEEWIRNPSPTICGKLVRQLERHGFRKSAYLLLESSQRRFGDQDLELMLVARLASGGRLKDAMWRAQNLTGSYREAGNKVLFGPRRKRWRILFTRRFWRAVVRAFRAKK